MAAEIIQLMTNRKTSQWGTSIVGVMEWLLHVIPERVRRERREQAAAKEQVASIIEEVTDEEHACPNPCFVVLQGEGEQPRTSPPGHPLPRPCFLIHQSTHTDSVWVEEPAGPRRDDTSKPNSEPAAEKEDKPRDFLETHWQLVNEIHRRISAMETEIEEAQDLITRELAEIRVAEGGIEGTRIRGWIYWEDELKEERRIIHEHRHGAYDRQDQRQAEEKKKRIAKKKIREAKAARMREERAMRESVERLERARRREEQARRAAEAIDQAPPSQPPQHRARRKDRYCYMCGFPGVNNYRKCPNFDNHSRGRYTKYWTETEQLSWNNLNGLLE